MAQLVFSAAGSAIGGSIGGGIGAAIGQTLGAALGASIDNRYLTPPVEGPRIREFHLMESREGAGIPVVYGRCRVGGQVIWAARFKESRHTSGGGKGGPRVRTYSYSLSFAVALCEGEVARVSRCWANGEPLDLSKLTWRLHAGTDDQAPDPLIEAIEGAGNAPAYRGLAYIVFEDLPVDDFGARMPQLSFEVVRPAAGSGARLETMARAVNLIPGSGEFGLATDIVRRRLGPGREQVENQHGPEARSDFEMSLDQLQAELPNVSRVNLVIGWFGDDLRCDQCRVRPGVEAASRDTVPLSWSVAGYGRGDAHHITTDAELRLSYGGTPSDNAVRQAVAMLKARGLHVTLYPFLFMDIPAANGLADPYGGAEQAVHPWRGRLTCMPAPGRPGTVENTAAVETQLAGFFEGAHGYRDFILHYAQLVEESGADGLLIGSELRGLTLLRDGAGGYPAVDALCDLAADVRSIVGSGVEISYGADWTEYGAQVHGADLAFPLDALWAHAAISYVGLDWYPPMADWRDSLDHADAAFRDGHSLAYLSANVAGGEAFDWYYADDASRAAQTRLPITDGAHAEPWIYRQKDVASWWGHPHHPRIGGVRSASPTAWNAGLKPVRFVETGCPAVDKGANQPNVFYDPKSSESALPHFSAGTRDDLIQRRALEAFLGHWASDASGMVPADGVGLWAWDARPFPSFSALGDVWGDSANWRLGHWLNGRVGAALLPDVLSDICRRAGIDDANTSGAGGIVAGYRFDGPVPARAALEPLTAAYGVDAVENDGLIAFRARDGEAMAIDVDTFVLPDDGPALNLSRTHMEATEPGVRLRFIDAEADYAPGAVVSAGSRASDLTEIALPLAMDRGAAQARANDLSAEGSARRETARFAMAAEGLRVEAGDVLQLPGGAYRVTDVTDGAVTRFALERAGPARRRELAGPEPAPAPQAPPAVEPDIVIIDAPQLPGQEDDLRPLAFAYADPWPGALTISAGADATSLTARGEITQPCRMGVLVSGLYPHVSGRWQETSLWVDVPGDGPASASQFAVLNGANAALVETASGWEMIQFCDAELVGPTTYKLTRLLRGQRGSEPEMASGASVGARIVFLTGAEARVDVSVDERGLTRIWRGWRSSPDETTAWSETAMHGAGARAWSPAHVRATWVGSDIALAWIRRAAKGGDGWEAAEPVLEGAEAYRIRVMTGSTEKRRWLSAAASTTYASADRLADFPSGGAAVIEISQLGADGVPGTASRISLSLP